MLLDREDLAEVLDEFPVIQHAFAYGSAVFHQPSRCLEGLDQSSRPKRMLDFIFAVEDPLAWHQQVGRSQFSMLCLLLGLHANQPRGPFDRILNEIDGTIPSSPALVRRQ
jgi:Phosphatidate cytidylyltransferase, mitochondrial